LAATAKASTASSCSSAREAASPADIQSLLRTIEEDQTLVYAAYYTDDECIARIADWIAAEDDMPSNAAIAAQVRGKA
jgi:hypothetical protein